MSEPARYVTLRRGKDYIVKTDLGDTRELRLCVVPGRLALDLLMAAGNEDPQTVVALAAGLPTEDLDWVATDELSRLQDEAIELNFEPCAAMADSRAAAAKRMLPVLRKAGKKAIDQAMDSLLTEWEASMTSRLGSLNSITGQAPSSENPPTSSSPRNPSPASWSGSEKPPSGKKSKAP